MFPSHVFNCTIDCPTGYSKLARKFWVRLPPLSIEFSRKQNMCIRQFCTIVLCPMYLVSTAFLFTITVVVKICSEKKMRRSYTKAVIAFVQNAQSLWNCITVDLPRNSVRFAHGSIIAPDFEYSISSVVSASSPLPTTSFQDGMNRTEFIDFFPEARDKICSDHFNLLQRLTWLCAPRLFKQFRSLFNKQVVYQFVEVQ